MIKITKTRLEMIKKKRCAMQKYLKTDISDLLQNGLDINAYSRVMFFFPPFLFQFIIVVLIVQGFYTTLRYQVDT